MVLHLQFSEMASSAGEEGGICCRRKLKQTNRNMVMVGSTFLSLSLSNFYFHHPCDEVTFPFVLDSHILLLWSKIEYSRYYPFQFTPMHPSHSHIIHRSISLTNSLFLQSHKSNGENMQKDDTPSLSIKKNVVLFYSRCYLRFVADISSNMFLK